MASSPVELILSGAEGSCIQIYASHCNTLQDTCQGVLSKAKRNPPDEEDGDGEEENGGDSKEKTGKKGHFPKQAAEDIMSKAGNHACKSAKEGILGRSAYLFESQKEQKKAKKSQQIEISERKG